MPYGTRKCNNDDCKRTCGSRNGKYDDICIDCWKKTDRYDNWCRTNGKGKYSTTFTPNNFNNNQVSSKTEDEDVNFDFDLLSTESSLSEDFNDSREQMVNLYNSLSATHIKLKSDLKGLKNLIKHLK